MDGRETHEDAPSGSCAAIFGPRFARELRPELQRMLERGVVVDCGPGVKAGDGPGDQVALGRMKIPARWIDPERPTRAPRLFPRGEGQRILKELGDRDTVQRSSGDVTEGERGS